MIARVRIQPAAAGKVEFDTPRGDGLPSCVLRALAGRTRAERAELRTVPTDLSGGVLGLAEIKMQEGESIENALRRFKRKVQQEDIIKDIKKHSFYLKPGDRRRAKQALARKRNRKKIRREAE